MQANMTHTQFSGNCSVYFVFKTSLHITPEHPEHKYTVHHGKCSHIKHCTIYNRHCL